MKMSAFIPKLLKGTALLIAKHTFDSWKTSCTSSRDDLYTTKARAPERWLINTMSGDLSQQAIVVLPTQ